MGGWTITNMYDTSLEDAGGIVDMSENLDAMTKEFIGSRAAMVFEQYLHITGDGGDYRVRLQEAKADLNLLLDRARAEGAANVLANPISRGTLYVNTGGIGDLPDGKYPIITVLAPTKEKP